MDGTRIFTGRRRGIATSLLACSLIAPMAAGCGRGADNGATGSAGSLSRPAPGGYGNQGYGTMPGNARQNPGMSTGKKVAILAGAAALAYLYNKHKNAKGTGAQGQYYRSRDGRIYYRDERGQPVYVNAPAGGIQVPAEVAERYNRAARSGNFNFDDPSLNTGGYANGY